MSQAQIEDFYKRVSNDQELFRRLLDGTTDSGSGLNKESFLRNAVKAAGSMGYQFTFEEAEAWSRKQQELEASGELSNLQLESVAGGKGEMVPNDPRAIAELKKQWW